MNNEIIIMILVENAARRVKSRKYTDVVKSEVEIALRTYITMTEEILKNDYEKETRR